VISSPASSESNEFVRTSSLNVSELLSRGRLENFGEVALN